MNFGTRLTTTESLQFVNMEEPSQANNEQRQLPARGGERELRVRGGVVRGRQQNRGRVRRGQRRSAVPDEIRATFVGM